MLLRHNPLTSNDLRQCLRIATGSTIGFTLCKFFDWNYGVFFTVIPMLLLGLIPVVTGQAVRQLLISSTISGIEVGL